MINKAPSCLTSTGKLKGDNSAKASLLRSRQSVARVAR
jgi:hypothetical protein